MLGAYMVLTQKALESDKSFLTGGPGEFVTSIMRTFCRNLSIQGLGFVACLAAVVDKRRDKLGLDLQVSVNGRVTRGQLWADSID
jgi:hypothetical protein